MQMPARKNERMTAPVACLTCRELKLRCDRRYPACGTCKINRRLCKGYQARNDSSSSSSSSTGSSRTTSTATSPSSSSSASISSPALTTSHARRDQLLALFLDQYVPAAYRTHSALPHDIGIGISWVSHLLASSSPSSSSTLNAALTAMSLAILGRRHRDMGLVKQSFSVYGTALAELRTALRRPKERARLETLAAMMAMGTFELWQPTLRDGQGWMAHIAGATRIVQQKGVGAGHGGEIEDGEGEGESKDIKALRETLMSNFRISSAFDSIARRKGSFLSLEGWKPVRGSDARPADILIDLLCDYPWLLERSDKLLRLPVGSSSNVNLFIALFQDFARYVRKLQDWFENLERVTDGPLFWANEDMRIEGSPFEDPLEYPSIAMAHIMGVYFSIRTLTYMEMDRLIEKSRYNPVANNIKVQLRRLDLRQRLPGVHYPVLRTSKHEQHTQYICSVNAIHFCDLACRSIDFKSTPNQGSACLEQASFSIWTTEQAYRGHCDEKFAWHREHLCAILKARGLLYGSIMASVGFERYPEVARGFSMEGRKAEFVAPEGIEEVVPRRTGGAG